MSKRKWLLVLPALSLGALAGVLILGSSPSGIEGQARGQEAVGVAGTGTPPVRSGKYQYVSTLFSVLKIDTTTGKTYALMPPLMDRPYDRGEMIEQAWVPVEHFEDVEKARKWFMERRENWYRRFDKKDIYYKEAVKETAKDFGFKDKDRPTFKDDRFDKFDKPAFKEKEDFFPKTDKIEKFKKDTDKDPFFDKKKAFRKEEFLDKKFEPRFEKEVKEKADK